MPFIPLHHRVRFGQRTGTDILRDGKDLMIMKESDILGVMA